MVPVARFGFTVSSERRLTLPATCRQNSLRTASAVAANSPGIAATAVFSLIFSWNEYAFALMLTGDKARTAPPSIPSMLGVGGIEWGSIAAGSLLFLIPVVFVTFALRNYLLRGVTFGAIRQ